VRDRPAERSEAELEEGDEDFGHAGSAIRLAAILNDARRAPAFAFAQYECRHAGVKSLYADIRMQGAFAMKTRLAIAALAAAVSLASPCIAGAQMMGGPGMGGFFSNGIHRGSGPFGSAADMQALASTWLNGLHAGLQVTGAQEPAWQAFANAVAAQAQAMQSLRSQMAAISATSPQRAALVPQFMRQRLDAMTAMVDALAALYAQLTPQQRAILDAEFANQCGALGLFGS
jgi:hypothetical protein